MIPIKQARNLMTAALMRSFRESARVREVPENAGKLLALRLCEHVLRQSMLPLAELALVSSWEDGYIIIPDFEAGRDATGAPIRDQGIICLHCGSTSYNPNDVSQRYCGRCHAFHPIPPGGQEAPAA